MTLLSNKKIAAIFIALSFIFLSCTMDNSNSNNEETPNYEYSGDNFVRGFDLSAVDYWENDEAPSKGYDKNWYDTDGSQKSIYAILKNHGIDTVRIRVWVDPENAPVTDESWPASKEWNTGDCTTERAVRMAKAAKDAGLKVLLDFHYSDYWTDPGKQVIPLSWQNITTKEGLAAKVSEYTTEVLTALKDGNATPDYVQVGNEIDSGILIHTSYNASSGAKPESNIAGKMSSANF
ncbi:glycosyl hydrolase 53 family protein, partial [Treponema sp.]|uniref:glycosyl hydrolase 53 family protein n=1 Tax=Treponema sp. TaxID=166 RepID=UPI0025EEDA26